MSIWSWLTRRRPGLDEDDFDEEIRAHLALAEQDRRDQGADADTAHFAARKEFGNITLTTEAARKVWTPGWLEALRDAARDVRIACRSLARSPAFSLIVVGVLAIGISVNASVFAILKDLTLTPLPGVARSGQLQVILRETSDGRLMRLSYPDFRFLRDHDLAFTGLMGTMFRLEQYRLGRGQSARMLSVEFVTGNYFEVLGVRAALGRTLQPSDELDPGRHPLAVLGHGLWQREFNSDPNIVGRTVEINRNPLTVVGVADASFHGTVPAYDVEVFIPITMAAEVGIAGPPQPNLLSDRNASLLAAHGFLRPGVSAAMAVTQVGAVSAALTRERSVSSAGERLSTLPFWKSPIGPQTYIVPMLSILCAMGSLVLLIVCANIAGLVLARGISRRGELGARLALGATRARVIRLLVIENLVLVVPGTILGVLAAQRALNVLVGFVDRLSAPQRMFFDIRLDEITLAFAALVAALCAIVFGLMPALQTSRLDPGSVINEDASPRGGTRSPVRATLVITQVAVSLVLLVGAGIVMRGLEVASRIDPGFDDQHVTSIMLDLQPHQYDDTRGRTFFHDLLDTLRADSTIQSASMASMDPLAFLDVVVAERIVVDGYAPRRGETPAAASNTVGTDYFRTLGIELVAGRPFDDRDRDTAMPVVIVNRTFAARFWGRPEAALGKRMRTAAGDWRTVVGVATDVKYVRLNESPRPYFYLPFAQAYRPAMVVYARSGADPSTVVSHLRARVAALDLDLAGDPVRPLSDVRRISLLGYQVTAAFLFVFGAAGMTLAAMGTYGLVSYTVLQHTREIGIRIALGATSLSVIGAFLGRSLRLAAIGGAIGVIVALSAGRLLGSVLYGVSLLDWLSFARALAIVMSGVILATLVPAWRAARTNPLKAIRHN